MKEESNSQYSPMAGPPGGSTTLAGTVGFVALLGGVLLAASYPVVVAAAVAGALLTSQGKRVSARVRCLGTPTTQTPGAADASAADCDCSPHVR